MRYDENISFKSIFLHDTITLGKKHFSIYVLQITTTLI